MSEDTREHLLKTGTELISLYGYHACGLDMILKTAGVPKGSFYHYFKSKEDFGLAVIDVFDSQHREKINLILTNTDLSPLERIRTYFQNEKQNLIAADFVKGCLAGNLGQELSAQNERFRMRIQEIFASWQKLFADCLNEAVQAGELPNTTDTKATAVFLLSGWEGAVLYAKVEKSAAPLDTFISLLEEKLFR